MVVGVANAQKEFRKLQIGKETVYGTEVAATRILRILGLDWNDQSQQSQYIPEYSIGRMSMHTDVGTIIRSGFGGRVETDLSFEDVLFPLLAGFKGGVVASAEKTVGQNDREWIFQNDPNTGDPTPDSYTLERRLSNGSTNWDRTVTGLLVSGIEIAGDAGGDVIKLNYDVWGRAPNGNAIAALSLPTPFTIVSALNTKLYFDDTWAAMDILGAAPSYGGGVQIATTMKSFSWKYTGGINPALYIGDGRTDPAKHRFTRRGVELEMTVEFNASVAAELTKAETSSKRYVRLLIEGARIGTGYNKTVVLQGAFIYPDGGIGEVGSDEDGTEVITLRLESLADDDTEDTEVRVINTLSAFP